MGFNFQSHVHLSQINFKVNKSGVLYYSVSDCITITCVEDDVTKRADFMYLRGNLTGGY